MDEELKPSKLGDYQAVLEELVSEAIACTPEHWVRGNLTIDCDGVKINYKLKNEEQDGMAAISEKLKALIEELYETMANHGDVWELSIINFEMNSEDYSFNVKFKYTEEAFKDVKVETKPWWKIW